LGFHLTTKKNNQYHKGREGRTPLVRGVEESCLTWKEKVLKAITRWENPGEEVENKKRRNLDPVKK